MMCFDTGAISSSCAQAFCANETAFYHGTAAIMTIDKKADAAEPQWALL